MEINFHRLYISPILLIGLCVFAEANIPDHISPIRSTYLHINGLNYHFDANPTSNDYLYGVGFHYDLFYTQDTQFSFLNRIMIALEADIFNDSQRHWAFAAGFSFTRLLHKTENFSFGFGITTGLIYKKNLRRDSDLPVYPLALPFIQIRTRKIKVRTTWIPPSGTTAITNFFFSSCSRWGDSSWMRNVGAYRLPMVE